MSVFSMAYSMFLLYNILDLRTSDISYTKAIAQ